MKYVKISQIFVHFTSFDHYRSLCLCSRQCCF